MLFKENNLLDTTSNKSYRRKIKEYWTTHYGKPVNPMWHIACANVIGKEDVRYIPHHIWLEEIYPFLNNLTMHRAYVDKNLSDIFIKTKYKTPRTVIKRMHSRYYCSENLPISRDKALKRILAGPPEQIIKASGTSSGFGIRKLLINDKNIILNDKIICFNELASMYGSDFIVQAKIVQHPKMAEPHPDSVNTVRLVTFRWHDTIRVLLSFARYGNGGSLIDNAGAGGVCCGINEKGQLYPIAVDMYGKQYRKHPSTGYDFRNQPIIPGYDKICEYGIRFHRNIYHLDIVSWDFTIDENGEPVFLEVNSRGASWVYQFACRRPMFGDLTEDVLECIRDN